MGAMVKLDHVTSAHQQRFHGPWRERRRLGRRDLQHPGEEIAAGPLHFICSQQPLMMTSNPRNAAAATVASGLLGAGAAAPAVEKSCPGKLVQQRVTQLEPVPGRGKIVRGELLLERRRGRRVDLELPGAAGVGRGRRR